MQRLHPSQMRCFFPRCNADLLLYLNVEIEATICEWCFFSFLANEMLNRHTSQTALSHVCHNFGCLNLKLDFPFPYWPRAATMSPD
jgi:hypothetical protein